MPRLLAEDAAVVAVAGSAWAVGALVQVPGGIAFVLDGVLMGAEDWAYLRTWTVAAAVSRRPRGAGSAEPGRWAHGAVVVRGGDDGGAGRVAAAAGAR